MRPFSYALLFVLVGVLPSLTALAGEPAQASPPKAEKSQPERVHLGSASVTVVDEHEAVDEVISRIRKGKEEGTANDKAKTADISGKGSHTGTTTDSRQENGRTSLRAQRDRASARAEAERLKDEKRDRATSTRTRNEPKQRR